LTNSTKPDLGLVFETRVGNKAGLSIILKTKIESEPSSLFLKNRNQNWIWDF
jgi:hypothetical protein